MTADLAAYAAAGAHTVQALMTGAGAWRTPHPNPWLFSRLTWNPWQDADPLSSEWRAALPAGALQRLVDARHSIG
jgi:hypothetical protein